MGARAAALRGTLNMTERGVTKLLGRESAAVEVVFTQREVVEAHQASAQTGSLTLMEGLEAMAGCLAQQKPRGLALFRGPLPF